jgi:hypothetical protein
MLADTGAATRQISDANEDGEENRDQNGGDAKCAAANLLEIFAFGYQEKITH